MLVNKLIQLPKKLAENLSPVGITKVTVSYCPNGAASSLRYECNILSTPEDTIIDEYEKKIAELKQQLKSETKRADDYEAIYYDFKLDRAESFRKQRQAELIDNLHRKLAGRMTLEQAVDLVCNKLDSEPVPLQKSQRQHSEIKQQQLELDYS